MTPAPAIVPAATPAPVTPAPTPVAATVPAAVIPAPPTHLFGLEAIGIVLRGNRGFRAFAARWHNAVFRRYRRQRRGLRTRSKCCSTGDISKGEFQKVAAFHLISSLALVSNEGSFVASR
jgi:hypothetical protein